MSTSNSLRSVIGLGALLLACTVQAQTVSSDANVPPATARKQAAEVAMGGPVRWDVADATIAARLRTIRKEAAAGLQENLGNCKREPAADRSACISEARAEYQKEMANARARAAMTAQ